MVRREGSPVKNIVIDLSNNGGGDSDAAIVVASWFTGEARFALGDSVSGGKYRLFCLTSPVSFSCGNLVPALFRQAGNVTLIGQRSGGGSNVVLPATTASGMVFQMSGPLQITTFTNGSLYGIDTGVEPHVRLNKLESFYDREGLVEMIHNLK